MTIRKILMIIEGEIATTKLLEQIFTSTYFSDYEFETKLISDLEVTDFDGITFPIFVRSADPYAARWAKQLIKANYPYIYYLDDNFWELDQTTEIGRYYSEPAVRKALSDLISNAETIIVNSKALGTYLEQFGRPVRYIPPVAQLRQLPSHLIQVEHEGLIVGGFAGSPSRSADLKGIWPAIENVLAKYPKFHFEIIGFKPDWEVDSGRVTIFEHVDNYDEYVVLQQERNWDFAVAPLARTQANFYKTNNKYREYSSMGIPAVYEDFEPYHCISNGDNGVSAGPDLESWSASLESLISNEQLRDHICNNAINDVTENYNIETSATKWIKIFLELEKSISISHELKRPRPLLFSSSKAVNLMVYSFDAIKRHGFIPAMKKACVILFKRGSAS